MELNPMKLSMASFNSVSTNGGEKIMITDIDYTDRLEKNIKNLQNMALDINNHTREDENVKKTEWIQQNKDIFKIPKEATVSKLKDF